MAYVPISHPFVECLIGTIRHEFVEHTLFWNARDQERRLPWIISASGDSLNKNSPWTRYGTVTDTWAFVTLSPLSHE